MEVKFLWRDKAKSMQTCVGMGSRSILRRAIFDARYQPDPGSNHERLDLSSHGFAACVV
jgi:hypothetical protein